MPVRESDMCKQQNSEKVWESLSSSAGEMALYVARKFNSVLVGQLVHSLGKLEKKYKERCMFGLILLLKAAAGNLKVENR